MRSDRNPGTISLSRHVSISLRDRAGDRIECIAGVLWITQDGDPRDSVIAAGESFILDRKGRALVYALSDTRLAVHEPARAPPALRWSGMLAAAREGWRAAPAPHALARRRTA